MRIALLLFASLASACSRPGAGGSLPGGSPPPIAPPAGKVSAAGGDVDRLFFAVTGDTRPARCDDLPGYPKETIAQLARQMRRVGAQFALDLGDHLYACDGSGLESAVPQLDLYRAAMAQGPETWFLTLGNHECGTAGRGGCPPGSTDPLFTAFLGLLGRPRPWYAVDVRTRLGPVRLVVVADDAWCPEQADWLEATLQEAEERGAAILVARHHPLTGDRRGPQEPIELIERHHPTLILSAHRHGYEHAGDHGGRAVVIGLGGAPSREPPGFGTVLQEPDGSFSFTLHNSDGEPVGAPWRVAR